MLPELLFSVGSSMQDISRDEFSLLNGGCDKDVTSTRATPPLPSTSPTASAGVFGTCTNTISNLETVNIKLEESSTDLYSASSWHHPHHHHHPELGSNKLLLRNSDDPLISRGATSVDDDNPNELNSIVAAAASQIKNSVQSMSTTSLNNSTGIPPASTLSPKRSRNTGGSRTRRKGAFKLRFHHQALPAEYLNHYEATQNQQNKTNAIIKGNEQAVAQHQANAHETVRSWLQKISDMQTSTNDFKETIELPEANISENPCPSQKSPRRVVNYSDLPYMGEMTLENSKPRRGRKPKKADICHLIYKNYGTIFPGTPKDLMEAETKGDIVKAALLEKQLTIDDKDKIDESPNKIRGEEPLNLCLRDQSTDSLTISSDDEESDDLIPSNRTTPIISPSDSATDALLAANLKMSLPNFQSALLDKSSDELQTPSTGESDPTSPNYVYWPTAGVFIHPMALYYQKMIDAGTLPPPASSTPTSLPANGQSLPKKQSSSSTSSSPKIVPKNLSQLMKKEKTEPPEPCSTPSSTKSSSSAATASTAGTNHPQPPQKRKRSAIFIPPMPAENTTNPATEVSICKFKFTGGAKPSLQEKKMLSVDSDGNYRYYSGTGDKSMRGYEFFPRESLQQSGVLPGVNCAGAFLSATGEKISNDLPPPSAGLSNELLQIPDSPTGSLILSPNNQGTSSSVPASTSHHQHHHQDRHISSGSSQASDRRKRKSRRSLQREKLEQTFKEKGFLIQTQQLESAEGATYCKFRQLRKFTRYLFRSWKDYLPGELQQANAAVVAAAAAVGNNHQTETIRNVIIGSNSNQSIIEKQQHKN